MLEGVLPIWKPQDWTSHDVVAKVRRITHTKKIGHAGTLDPKVCGVLPLCIGRATRIVEYLQDLSKTYSVKMKVGFSTDTEDIWGERTEQAEKVTLTDEQLKNAALSFIGQIEQTPPMYSAVKLAGKKLYEYAREGIEVERKARTVTIYDLHIDRIDTTPVFPEIDFTVICSKGTYIRTLCKQIGEKTGYPATMTDLVRTESASFTAEQSLSLEQVQQLYDNDELQSKLISIDKALFHIPSLQLQAGKDKTALHGGKINVNELSRQPEAESLFRVYSHEGSFIGIYKLRQFQPYLTPEKLFVTQ